MMVAEKGADLILGNTSLNAEHANYCGEADAPTQTIASIPDRAPAGFGDEPPDSR
jgi:hypothetical protein